MASPPPHRSRPSVALVSLVALGCVTASLAFAARSMHDEGTPVVVLGVISDVQYADADDGKSAAGVARFYRESLRIVNAAASAWAAVPASQGGVAAVVHVGDTVDGGRAATGPGGTGAAADAVQAALRSASRPLHFVLGNHEFAIGDRAALAERFRFAAASDGAAYRSFSPAKGVRVIILDSYAESTVGWPAGNAVHAKAQAVLSKHNPLPAGKAQNDPGALTGTERRWIALGGAVGRAQLDWLDTQLQEARRSRERVIVFTHVPVHPRAVSTWCGPLCLAWDYEAVLAVLRPHAGTVAACVSGHDHFGGAVRDASGIAFITLQAVIETKRGGKAHGELRLYDRHLRLTGSGRMRSRNFFLPPLPPALLGDASRADE